MAKPSLPPDSTTSDMRTSGAVPPVASTGTSTIDAPSILPDGQLDIEARSVKSTKHAFDICTATETANKSRSLRSADIQAFFDGQPPRSWGDKLQKGQAWQTNTNTRWLAGIVNPVVQRLTKAIQAQIYLTKSQLRDSTPDGKQKSEFFDNRTTKLIRSWPGFSEFVNQLAMEVGLHGYAYAAFLDKYTWKPKFFKQENAYVPEESTQHASDLQFFVAKMDYLLHDFIDLFKDEGAAEQAGYVIENCIQAANAAEVKNPRDDVLTTQYRKFADMVADGTLGLTYTAVGPRIVKTYLLWSREYDGKVTFWMISRSDGKLLRYAFKAYDSISDVACLFALEPGNGHIHSSKGLGRQLINTAIKIEDGRCNAFDATKLGSMLILKIASKDRAKMQPVIQSPFIVMDKEIDLAQEKFAANADQYLVMDQQLTTWAQQTSGAYISGVDPSGKTDKTATEASIDASREQESANSVQSRFVDQFSHLIQAIQRRVYSDENLEIAKRIFDAIAAGATDKDSLFTEDILEVEAVRAIVELLEEGLTVEEIKQLRINPASGLAHADDVAKNQGVQRVAAAYTGNPNIDQIALLKDNIEAMAGPEAAKRYVVKDIDQTVIQEALRLQMMESNTMLTLGIEVPVSPRDAHIVHGTAIQTLLTSMNETLSKDPNVPQNVMKAIELNLNHLASHLEAAKVSGASASPEFKALDQFHSQYVQDFQKVVAIQSQLQAEKDVQAAAVVADVAAAKSVANPPAAATPTATPPAGSVVPFEQQPAPPAQ